MTSDAELSFISQIHGIIQEQNSSSANRFFQNSLIFLGRMSIEKSLIWGLDQVDSFRESYEKDNFETFIKEQSEENFLNYHFISGFSGFTLKSFFLRFESILSKSLKLTPALIFRNEFEDSLINFLLNMTPTTILVKTKVSAINQEEEWFSKLSLSEKSKAANMRKFIYQCKKIFRDQLKEILIEECFCEKIESELLIDRMWSFLANMMQSGSIMKEISISLNNSNKTEADPFVKLFQIAIKILLQGYFIRKCPDNFSQRREIHQPVHRLCSRKVKLEIRSFKQKLSDREKSEV